jgi:peptidoglycan/xylan/chitin deacetylase (PgdA/CDA1 family)
MDWNCRIGQRIFPHTIWAVNSPSIYLTFDDGPDPEVTPLVLDLLKRFEAKATFFLLGRNVRSLPTLARRIVLEGHAIGNHGFSHTRLLFRAQEFIAREIEATNTEIQRATGISPTMFRPPHGQFDWRVPSLAASCGMRTVLWSVSARDYAAHSSSEIIDRMTSRIQGGDIVLLHDNQRTKDFLPAALEETLRWSQKHHLKFGLLSS